MFLNKKIDFENQKKKNNICTGNAGEQPKHSANLNMKEIRRCQYRHLLCCFCKGFKYANGKKPPAERH